MKSHFKISTEVYISIIPQSHGFKKRKCTDKPQTRRKHSQSMYLTTGLYPEYLKNSYESIVFI